MRRLWGQRGFTLVELVVVMAIGAVLITAAAMAITQIGKFARYGGDDLRAWHDIRYAVQWMSREIPMAETVTGPTDGGGPVSSMTLEWTEWSGCCTEVSHTISYSLVGSVVERNYDGSAITVAQQVEILEFSRAGRVITIRVRSSPGQAVEEMTHLVYLRPD